MDAVDYLVQKEAGCGQQAEEAVVLLFQWCKDIKVACSIKVCE
jgi:hypothetical protein